MKKVLSFLLALLLLASVSSCSDAPASDEKEEAQKSESAESGVSDAPQEELSEEELRQKLEKDTLASLPDADFDGYTFTFLASINSNPEWRIWENRDIYAEELLGEVINDAVINRNTYIEDRYNCSVGQYKSYEFSNDLYKTIHAGDNAYDITLPPLSSGIALAMDGDFYDLNAIDSVDLDGSWWDQNANRSLSVAHKLYFTSGDLLILVNDSIGAFVFNKQLIDDWNIEDPYSLVREGTWTYDKLEEQIGSVSHDVNGDGKMDGKDQYGLMVYADVQHCLYHGAGLDYAGKDENDLPVLTYNTEHSLEVLERSFELLNNTNQTYSLHNAYNEFGGANAFVWGEGIFEEDRVLYYWLRLRDIEGLRDMETDFGILPIPKWDEAQENYRATVNYYVSCGIAIPISCSEPEPTGLFLNALCCKSKYELQPAYYDITLTGKYPRDVESSEMLDLMFANRVFDIGMFGNFGSLTDKLKTMLIDDNRNFASSFRSIDQVAARLLDRTVKAITELDH